jgi:hypothetical protein
MRVHQYTIRWKHGKIDYKYMFLIFYHAYREKNIEMDGNMIEPFITFFRFIIIYSQKNKVQMSSKSKQQVFQ